MADTTSPDPIPADDGNPAPDPENAVANKSILSGHKTHLAIGVAATLGIMIFYNWREKRLAKQDPEGYARLQRLKASVRSGDAAQDGAGKNPEAADNVHKPNAAEILRPGESSSDKPEMKSLLP